MPRNKKVKILRWITCAVYLFLMLWLGNRYGMGAFALGVGVAASMGAYVGLTYKENGDKPSKDPEPEVKGELLQLTFQRAAAEMYMRDMAREITNPCRFCRHEELDGRCFKKCTPGTDDFGFEWRDPFRS